MDLENNRLHYLVRAYMDGVLDSEELSELRSYLRRNSEDDDLDLVVDQLWSALDHSKSVPVESELMYKKIWEDERVQPADERPVFARQFRGVFTRLASHWLAKAASIILVLSACYFYYQGENEQAVGTVAQSRTDDHVSVLPGTNKATLTLASGKTINLELGAKGDLVEEAGMKIIKTRDGEIHYQTAPDGEHLGGEYHVISTPRGGEYSVTLPDGTKVWLNSVSSLRYPVRFADEERVVELTGEAYFEVARKTMDPLAESVRQPFIVKTATQSVEVLGTHFNINSYGESNTVKTTLLEGSVAVSRNHPGSGPAVILKPGQQAQLSGSADGTVFRVSEVDTEAVQAWKNGNFYFNSTPLAEVMDQLSRWYDVEIDRAYIPDYKFNGFIPREEPLTEVLEMLELTGDLKFTIHNKQISIIR